METEEAGPQSGTITEHYRQPNENLVQLQLNTSDILEDIEHKLKGEIYNEAVDEWQQKGEKLVNTDSGIREILSHLYTFLNRNVILSELNSHEILNIMQELDKEVTYLLGENAKRYTDNNIAKLDLIKRIITHTAFFTMKRALKRGEGKLLGQVTARVERYDSDEGGVLSRVMPFGGK